VQATASQGGTPGSGGERHNTSGQLHASLVSRQTASPSFRYPTFPHCLVLMLQCLEKAHEDAESKGLDLKRLVVGESCVLVKQ
jgi:hypothetical protein